MHAVTLSCPSRVLFTASITIEASGMLARTSERHGGPLDIGAISETTK